MQKAGRWPTFVSAPLFARLFVSAYIWPPWTQSKRYTELSIVWLRSRRLKLKKAGGRPASIPFSSYLVAGQSSGRNRQSPGRRANH